jgi:hypothetical protein
LFDKPFRNKEIIAHQPRRQLDPYEENEVKGTRMPDYSSLAGERDVYGELGWIPNFNVKLSKNNDDRHNNYREFFDAPKDYNVAFTNANVTNSEFFRENAPETSVACKDISKSLLKSPSPMGVSANSFHNA